MAVSRRRLDAELVRRSKAKSREAAQGLIESGRVTVDGQIATKSANQVSTSAAIEILGGAAEEEYVSRGAHKLLGALERLGERAPCIEGKRCLDAGASTGGFTDVLLQKGAESVVAVDVGYGQLAWKLRNDPRVEVLERTNIRYLEPDQVGTAPQLVVGDLSFISLKIIMPALLRCAPQADYLLMVKPQFEVGKGRLPKGGVVRDPSMRAQAVADVAHCAQDLGFKVWAIEPSPLPGPAGNVEYFLAMSTDPSHPQLEDLDAAARTAVEVGPHPERGTND